MADDIDIEEHDLMENPVIRSIFPDLSVLKKEIEYVDGMYDIPEEPSDVTIKDMSLQNNKMLTNKTCNMKSKIKNQNIADVKVYLKNIMPMLLRDQRFCQRCLILFSKKSAFDDHSVLFHNYENHREVKLIDNKTNKRTSSLVPPHAFNKKSRRKNISSPILNECDILVKKKTKTNESVLKDNSIKPCFHCKVMFPTQQALIDHLYELLYEKQTQGGNQLLSYDPVIAAKNETLQTQDIENNSENQLVTDNHNKLSDNEIENQDLKRQCDNQAITNDSILLPEKEICQSKSPSVDEFSENENIAGQIDDESITNDPSSLPVKEYYQSHPLSDDEFIEIPDIETQCDYRSITNDSRFLLKNESLHSQDIEKKDEKQSLKIYPSLSTAQNSSKNQDIDGKRDNQLCTNSFTFSIEVEISQIQDNERQDKNQSVNPDIAYSTEDETSQFEDIEKQEFINSNKMKSKNKKSLYKCYICSYYFRIKRFYLEHLNIKHKVNKTNSIEFVEFDSKCKFCNLLFSDVSMYNRHLYQSHRPEVVKKPLIKNHSASSIKKEINECLKRAKLRGSQDNLTKKNVKDVRVMVSKIFLFRCSECGIHFFTSEDAKNHTKHSLYMENWKCYDCLKLFKFKDQNSHIKQHQYSKYFTTREVKNCHIQSNVLYKCPTCAIHFQKDKIKTHIKNCELNSCIAQPSSSYCKLCDILIDCEIKINHEKEHEVSGRKPADFEVIYTESISQVDKSEIINDTLRICKKNKNKLQFICCHVCKCSIPKPLYNGHSYFHCKLAAKHVCEFCGLLFVKKHLYAHKNLHVTNCMLHGFHDELILQDFEFYDLKNKSKIRPMTVFPKCNICEKYFASNFEVDNHQCKDDDYVACSKCRIKLSNKAFTLHEQFHTYKLDNIEQAEVQLFDSESVTSKRQKLDNTKNINTDEINFSYLCKNCDVAVNEYDEVVEHCHLHNNLNKIQADTIECATCKLNFLTSTYDFHKQLHETRNEHDFKCFTFDVLYFNCNKNEWLSHVFGALPRDVIDKIIKNSIYKYETRLKMEIVQNGQPETTLYKCERCLAFINVNSIYLHTESCRKNSKKYVCATCNLPFLSNLDVSEHEKEYHKLNIESQCRIVGFNKQEDKKINYSIARMQKYYVLHECRYCHVIVDLNVYEDHDCNSLNLKNCNKCGLLLHERDYEMHTLKHKQVESFNKNFMKVIFIGNKNIDRSVTLKNNMISMFNGIVCDYKLYKCVICDVCVRDLRSVSDHYCLIDVAKFKCPICDFVFDEGKLKGHLKLHEVDPDFTKDTVMIETFGHNKFIKFEDETKTRSNKIDNKEEIVFKLDINDKPSKFNDDQVIDAKIYKCHCELHFIDIIELQEHSRKCSGKAKSKHNCFKCGLTFSPNVLFKHLLTHHCNKNIDFKYEIIEELTNLT